MKSIIIAKDNIGIINYKICRTLNQKIEMKLYLHEKHNESLYVIATYFYDLKKDKKKKYLLKEQLQKHMNSIEEEFKKKAEEIIEMFMYKLNKEEKNFIKFEVE